ncbi:hypothetical protein [Paenibacillus montanisoli]|uniref:LPXTG cell wall anchor domain-containing protein n=1 Tax=Paenibacillus montanisoli TaxID=2081970 RepID=A0A328TZG6_9BACL|nr:hypothetical protein [Paenibacillus montanisoli]RAP73995.1 hypothetical protein DL346_23245 [Paenibacillus montanisoli]
MRKMFMKTAMLVVAIFLVLAPTSAWAYSYGDANTEDVAETFKVVAAALSKSSPDWKTAEAAHKERREEIAAHFGESVAKTLDSNIKARQAKETIANYKALLVMNLDRRFENTLKDVSDYTNAKMLLAKARATFVVLSPYAEAKLSAAKIQSLNADFDTALEAIGNPGLFGVGQKDADEKALKDAVNRIYGSLKPLFPYTVYKAPAKPAAGGGTSSDKGTTAKPPTTAGTGNTDKGTASKPAASDAKPSTPAKDAEKEQQDDKAVQTAPDAAPPADAPDAAAGDAAADEGATDAAADDTAAEEPAADQPADAASTDDQAVADNAAADDTAAEGEVASAEPDTIDGTKEHAAMARTDKTNPAVTVGVIGGVAVVGAGAVWLARRKGFF